MDLFDLYAKISLDDGEFNEKMDGATKKGSSFASSLKTGLAVAGKAVVAVGAAAGGAAFALGEAVVKSFGELEQNIGGSEAVFGEYAASLQKTGSEAYKTLGTSLSDYLATANKMGALFQGAGISQERSLELTTSAMQRAADMASVMGIDAQVALDSVTGAAKGNYTMMDNLGVAMNDTSLKAYALAKGLDITWESATQAEKAEVAMQMFLENTAQYAGNFEREATQTISGSIGMLKSSITDFVAGMGNADADTAALAGNIVSSFQAVIKNVTPVLKNIVKAIPPALDALVGAVGEMLPELLTAATSLFNSVLTTIIGLLPQLIPAAFQAIMTIANALIENLPLLIETAMQIIISLALGLAKALPTLIPTIVDVVLMIVQTLIDNIGLLVKCAIQLMIGLAKGLINAIPQIIEKIPEIVVSLVAAFIENAPLLLEAGVQLIVMLGEGILNELVNIFTSIGGWVDKNIVQPIRDKVSDFRSIGRNMIVGIWNGINDKVAWLKSQVRGVVDKIKSWFTGKDGFDEHSPSKWGARVTSLVMKGFSNGFVGGIGGVMYNIGRVTSAMKGGLMFDAEYSPVGVGAGTSIGSGYPTIIQNIESVPQTPVELAAATAAYFEQARWN